MQARPGGEPEFPKRLVVGDGVARRLGRIVEQQEEAVRTSDLAAVVTREKSARAIVVRGPQLCGATVAEARAETRAVHHVGEEQRTFVHVR